MLELKNINYNYDNWQLIINQVSFNKGEITSLVGKSGLGKSTLLNIIAGFHRDHTGEILLDNADISSMKANKRDVNILFQNNNLFHQLTVWENVAIGLCPNLKPTKAQQQSICETIKKVQLSDKKTSYPKELSGGQQQRVAIARILVRNKKILLLDEPFNGLDKELRMEILQMIKAITQEKNLITILVSHQQEDLALSTHTHEISQLNKNNSILKFLY